MKARSPANARRLRAGPLSMLFADGDIRDIRVNDRPVLQRVYFAVRDRNWGTVANRITDLAIDERGDAFEIRYRVENREGDIHFRWGGSIRGFSSGAVEWSMEGAAAASFLKNRIGYCVLHGAGECAGAPCSVETVEGQSVSGVFPRLVAPRQPFRRIRAIRHQVTPEVTAEVRFSGDVFEMEDQRNWTDDSFKTYSTPLDLPFPARIEAGTEIRQTIRLSVAGPTRASTAVDGPLAMELSNERCSLPPIGLGGASGAALDSSSIGQIARLRLAHARADLSPAAPDDSLEKAAANARALSIPLEIELAADTDLEAMAVRTERSRAAVARWLAPGKMVGAARRRLSALTPGACFAAGSGANFAELNRNRPDPASCDAVWFALNPQVHAFDDLSLVENLSAQAAVVESAHRFSGGKPVLVSPVTLKPRSHGADPRQRTGFGAAWTLGSLLHLAGAGAASVTYYEMSGERGVLGFPVFDLLTAVGEFAGGTMTPARSSDPSAVQGLVLRRGARQCLLAANFTDEILPVRFFGRTLRLNAAGVTREEAW